MQEEYFKPSVITDVGLQLLKRVIKEKGTIEFTKMWVGSGNPNANEHLELMTEIVEPILTIPVTTSLGDRDSYNIVGTLDNRDGFDSFRLREIGLYAKDEENREVLYSYTYMVEGEIIPHVSTVHMIRTFAIDSTISRTDDVTINVDNSIVYATQEDLRNHATNTNNPHGVIISQIPNLQNELNTRALIEHTHVNATVSTNGFMSNTDKSRLDSITPSNTLPSAHGVANAGTSAQYARANHVHPAQTNITGNAGTATRLQTPRIINGTNFDGSANITTANWGTARMINGSSIDGSANVTTINWGAARAFQIGNATRNVNGGVNIVWPLADIGAASIDQVNNLIQESNVASASGVYRFGDTLIQTGTIQLTGNAGDIRSAILNFDPVASFRVIPNIQTSYLANDPRIISVASVDQSATNFRVTATATTSGGITVRWLAMGSAFPASSTRTLREDATIESNKISIILDDDNHIVAVARGGSLENGIVVDYYYFTEDIQAYKYVDGKIILDEGRLQQLHKEQLAEKELQELQEVLSETDAVALQWWEENELGFEHEKSEEEFQEVMKKRQDTRTKIRNLREELKC